MHDLFKLFLKKEMNSFNNIPQKYRYIITAIKNMGYAATVFSQKKPLPVATVVNSLPFIIYNTSFTIIPFFQVNVCQQMLF
jgi:hypothetical protein